MVPRLPSEVILVTTKKGSETGIKVNYNNSFRIATPLNLNSQADSYSWALFMKRCLDVSSDHFDAEWLQRIKDYQDGLLKDPLVVGFGRSVHQSLSWRFARQRGLGQGTHEHACVFAGAFGQCYRVEMRRYRVMLRSAIWTWEVS